MMLFESGETGRFPWMHFARDAAESG